MKILITARDVGAALHLTQIVKYLMRHHTCVVYVQNPADYYFKLENIPYKLVLEPIIDKDSNAKNHLIKVARDIFIIEQPDIVLSGLTTPFDIGIDEAMIYVAKDIVQTFVFQDFWGAVNDNLDVLADCYLCLDSIAVERTQSKYNVKAIAVGAPKYISYANADYDYVQLAMKRKMKADRRIIVGYFGQGLHHIPGYLETLHDFLYVVSNMDRLELIYKPHPRESKVDVDSTIQEINKYNIKVKLSCDDHTISTLLKCDIVCSTFSNCSYDAAFLNYFSPEPLILPVNLMYNNEIRNYYNDVVKLTEVPYRSLGLAQDVNYLEDLSSIFGSYQAYRSQVWKASKGLDSPVSSTQKILNIITTKAIV